MDDLTMSILGFPAVNRDLEVNLIDAVTRKPVRTVAPFLDGTVRIPQVPPGNYEVEVKHPNLALPVFTRPIVMLPHGPTNVTVLLDPSKFRNTAIEDIPEANLRPVADLSGSIAATIAPLANKAPGEAIKSSDWNALAGAVRDLANTNVQLTQLVSPVGHDHPELVAKIEEMSSNFSTLLDTMSQALAELQRQILTLSLQKQVNDVLDNTGIVPPTKRKEFDDLIQTLQSNVTASPTVFSKAARATGQELSAKLEALVDEHAAADPTFVGSPEVTKAAASIDLLKTNRATSYGSELVFNRKLDRSVGGSALTALAASKG